MKKTLYDPKSVRGGSFGQMHAIDVKNIEIPRCKKCAGIQNRISRLSALYVVLLLTIPIAAGFQGYRLELKLDMPDLSIYIGLGTLLLGLIFMFPFIKLVKPLLGGHVPHWTQLPEIKEWISKGWSTRDTR